MRHRLGLSGRLSRSRRVERLSSGARRPDGRRRGRRWSCLARAARAVRGSPHASLILCISRKDSLGARRILELTLRLYPVLSVEAVCVTAIDVDLVGPVSDVFGRYDNERGGMSVINHSDDLSGHRRQARGVYPRPAARFMKLLPPTYPQRPASTRRTVPFGWPPTGLTTEYTPINLLSQDASPAEEPYEEEHDRDDQ